MRKINKLILHCSATPRGRDVKTDTIRDWHLAKGWADIGYHYVIELDGSVNMGRDVSLIGAHTLGENKGSIGICYVGGMNLSMTKPEDTRTDEQKEALRCLITDLKGRFKNLKVYGHYNFSAKACPSFNVEEEGY
jgi:N-acetylmuramoyl-L-alanine amidase